MSISTGATDVVGGYPTAFGGGFGGGLGIPAVGLFGVFGGFGNRNGFGNDGFIGNGAIPGTTVLEQNVSELRKDVAEVNTEVHKLGNELQVAFNTSNMNISNNFRNLDNQICAVDKTVMQGNFALSQQMSNFQHSVDQQFCAVKQQINADGDATRALITQNLIDGLRSELASERRGRDNREIEINVTQTNQQTQNQLQAQIQSQNQFLATMFNSLGDQVNRANNSIVNLGGTVAAGQTNTNANTKINS